MTLQSSIALTLLAALLCGVAAHPAHAQGTGSSFLQRFTITSTGRVDMRVDDDGEIESVKLQTYRDGEGNTAQWADLSTIPTARHDGVIFSINAFPSSDLMPEDDAITLTMRLPGLDLECPCEPAEAALRLYVHGTAESSLYQASSLNVMVEKIERQRQDRVRIAGRFDAELVFYPELDGPPDQTDRLRVEASFDVISDRR